MKKEECIKSVSEFEEKYFPKASQEKKEKELTPQEVGILWAKKAIENLKKNIKIFA